MTFNSTFGRVFSPTFQPKSQAIAAADGWWLSGGIAAANCVAAYQAKGMASYAASLADLTGNGYDIDGGTAPDWNVASGWLFNGSTHCLNISDFPINNGNFTVAIFAKPNITTTVSSGFIYANSLRANNTVGLGWGFKAEQYNNTGKVGLTFPAVADYTSTIVTPTTDMVFICTKAGTAVNIYAGGSSSAITTGAMGTIVNTGLRIGGGINPSWGLYDPFKGYVYAVSMYNAVLSAPQIAALSTAMAAL